jgi:hypothetical protein
MFVKTALRTTTKGKSVSILRESVNTKYANSKAVRDWRGQFFGSLNNSRSSVLYTHKHLRRVRSLADDGSNSPHCCSICHPCLPSLISRLGGGGGVFTIVQLIAPSLLPYRCNDTDAGIGRVCQSELEAVSPLLLVLLFDDGGGPRTTIAASRS